MSEAKFPGGNVPAPHIDHGLENVRIVENGVEKWPCRCGHTHEGDYAIYDWAHHNCRHEDYDLLCLGGAGENQLQIMCAGCGNTWIVNTEDSFDAPIGLELQKKKLPE